MASVSFKGVVSFILNHNAGTIRRGADIGRVLRFMPTAGSVRGLNFGAELLRLLTIHEGHGTAANAGTRHAGAEAPIGGTGTVDDGIGCFA
jgi:hypothetical protein